MNLRVSLAANALLLIATSAFAGTAVSSLHPEEAIPDDLALMASPGPHADFIRQVQEKLHQHGFDAGPVNGDFGTKTQAALAQFQLAQVLPASGMLDDETLQALGVARAADQRGEGATVEAGTDSGSAASGSTSGR